MEGYKMKKIDEAIKEIKWMINNSIESLNEYDGSPEFMDRVIYKTSVEQSVLYEVLDKLEEIKEEN
jgi:hypothetical protein